MKLGFWAIARTGGDQWPSRCDSVAAICYSDHNGQEAVMRELGILEAKTGFSALVAEVERTGEDVMVTRHGRPVARIVPVVARRPLTAEERATLVRQIIVDRERQPKGEPFDIREALDRDRGEEWS